MSDFLEHTRRPTTPRWAAGEGPSSSEDTNLAELDRAHVAARVAWEAARTYEEAAYSAFAAASTRYILAIAAQERGQS